VCCQFDRECRIPVLPRVADQIGQRLIEAIGVHEHFAQIVPSPGGCEEIDLVG